MYKLKVCLCEEHESSMGQLLDRSRMVLQGWRSVKKQGNYHYTKVISVNSLPNAWVINLLDYRM